MDSWRGSARRTRRSNGRPSITFRIEGAGVFHPRLQSRSMTRATFGLALTIGAAALAAPQTPQPSNLPPLPDTIPTSGSIHSVILLAGSKAGDEVVWKTPDGTIHAFYQYNDRARGPKI